jgi:hypothetical protein
VVPPDTSSCPALVAGLNRPNAAGALGSTSPYGVGETEEEAAGARCQVRGSGECGRGKCVQIGDAGQGQGLEAGWGLCVCEPDVIGERCEHSLLEVANPHAPAPRPAPPRIAPLRAWLLLYRPRLTQGRLWVEGRQDVRYLPVRDPRLQGRTLRSCQVLHPLILRPARTLA